MAETKPQAAAMPQPTEEHEKLHILAGDWEGDEEIAPSPWGPGGPAKGRSNIRVAVDGFFLVQDYVEVKDPATDVVMVVAERWAADAGWKPTATE